MAAVREGRALSRWAGIGVAACALGFAAFYALLFWRDNAAPVASDAAAAAPAPGMFLYATERCEVDGERLRVQGWALRKGQGWPIGGNRVLLRLGDGRLRALDTAWQARPQLAPLLKARTGEKRTYYAPGFAASLNLAVAGVSLQGARLFLDWRAGDTPALLPLDCAGLSP
ncbi:hypothetical protein [Pseudoxanthomonas winnipegensis]|uniref:hypothetical protein n=1 Tax=Pseudoxanthomonas winnipegensis TaxID=2480810 RepID=UPI00103A43F8|nr:hypothetical protein [Pseudoxanthomonas winnipegensis]TBV70390.1 hypothetical protein EYC45_18505 [Pseudoxanthomonas winnipegensis]